MIRAAAFTRVSTEKQAEEDKTDKDARPSRIRTRRGSQSSEVAP